MTPRTAPLRATTTVVSRNMAPLTIASNAKRAARAEVRRGLANGSLTLGQVLADPGPEIAEMCLFELVLMKRRWGRGKLAKLNRSAVYRGYNLALPVAQSHVRTREWLVAQVEPGGGRDVVWGGLTFMMSGGPR